MLKRFWHRQVEADLANLSPGLTLLQNLNSTIQGIIDLEDVLKVFGDYKSLLHKQSPPPWTNTKLRFSNPRRWVLSV
ncbi:hypothetical protein VB713_20815 [Anabaena cylindrica UHCC 0172]|uniref:hypothetical protein n=1 Tax=Anabaena cylindrica TaxID=1165 RepID=UPI002B213DA2|nr:hypothetical protein [Anabaena cylindrica]MEA5553384.1 hypothetical protein [Anabaena cylindrica UHCC 0172]